MLLGLALRQGVQGQGRGDAAVVVYREGSADSRAVADHYARARGVPAGQVIGLRTSTDVTLTRAEYEEQVERALIGELGRRGLARFVEPGAGGAGGKSGSRCIESSVRYIVLAWGMPYRVANAPALLAGQTNDVAAPLQRNNASVDSELCLLPMAGRYPLVAGVPNPFFSTTNRMGMHPTNGVFLVGRVDGPTPGIARRLVDHALMCETNGFMGEAYFDLRNITSGSYRAGDVWMTNAAAAARRLGFGTHVDNQPATLPGSMPLANVGIYAGWYTPDVDGPFVRDEVEFLPGSIAYHLHSFSAGQPRDATRHWVGPLLAKGATVTFGSVDEPYLEFTPNPHVFLELMWIGGFDVGEAGLASQPLLSWANAFFGDPLFRPFETDLRALEERQYKARSPGQAWTILRQVNMIIQTGQSPSVVRDQLEAYPLSTNHPVLAERVGQLYAADSRHKPAAQWYDTALSLQPSPQHRLRLMLALADSLALSQQRQRAFETLRAVEDLRPDYRELLSFRQRQLEMAKDILNIPEMQRLQDEIVRIKAPPPPKPVQP